MAWNDVIGGVSHIETSEIESRKFGRNIGRFFVGENWIEQFNSEGELQQSLLELWDADKHDLTVVRVPSGLIDLINTTDLKNRSLLFVGTLVYWEICLNEHIPNFASGNTETAEQLGKDKYGEIYQVLDSSFSNYKNHYTANPLLQTVSANESYRDWAFHVLENTPENVVVVKLDGKIAGLAVINFYQGGPVEILLAGIGEHYQRRGAYVSLLSGVCRIASDRGFDHVVISTQSRNISVQKAWAKAGFSPALSIDTFHSLAK